MEKKDMYELRELYDKLAIPLAELGRRAGVSELTVAKIRDGHSARRSSVNSLLAAFAKIYELDNLSIDTVRGIVIKDKLSRQEQAPKPPVSTPVIDAIPEKEVAQNRTTMAKKSIPSETSPTRPYNRKKDTDLSEGSILATDFAKMHGVAPTTFRDHMTIGIGPKGSFIHGPDVPEDGSVLIKDWVRYEERPKRVRKDGTTEMERYLTPEQQAAALEFWKRHGVPHDTKENN